MAEYRTIKMDFWTDPFIEDLPPHFKLLYFYLISSPHTDNLGILEITKRRIVYETGIPQKDVEKALSFFQEAGKVVVDGNILWLVNFIKNQTTTSPMIIKSLKKLIDNTGSSMIKKAIRGYYSHIFEPDTVLEEKTNPDTVSIPYTYPMDTIPIPIAKEEVEVEVKEEVEVEVEVKEEVEVEVEVEVKEEVEEEVEEEEEAHDAKNAPAPGGGENPLRQKEDPEEIHYSRLEIVELYESLSPRFQDINKSPKIFYMKIREWISLYEKISVPFEIRKAAQWLRDNPGKKYKSWSRFMGNWLSRSHERQVEMDKKVAACAATSKPNKSRRDQSLEDWLVDVGAGPPDNGDIIDIEAFSVEPKILQGGGGRQ